MRVTDVFDVIRNPVGQTHEDIDAIFALIRKECHNKDITTVAAFKRLVEDAFSTYSLPVVIVDVVSKPRRIFETSRIYARV